MYVVMREIKKRQLHLKIPNIRMMASSEKFIASAQMTRVTACMEVCVCEFNCICMYLCTLLQEFLGYTLLWLLLLLFCEILCLRSLQAFTFEMFFNQLKNIKNIYIYSNLL